MDSPPSELKNLRRIFHDKLQHFHLTSWSFPALFGQGTSLLWFPWIHGPRHLTSDLTPQLPYGTVVVQNPPNMIHSLVNFYDNSEYQIYFKASVNKEWIIAMSEELQSIKQSQIRWLVEFPPGRCRQLSPYRQAWRQNLHHPIQIMLCYQGLRHE